MQRRINVFDPYPEAIEVDQGSVANNTSMSQQSSFNGILNPADGRLSNNAVSPEDTPCMNAVSHEAHRFYGWNSGESSSRFSSHMSDDEIKMEGRWPPSDVMVGPRSDIGQFEPASNIYSERINIGAGGNQIRSRPPFLRGSSSNHATLNLNTAERYATDSDNRGWGNASVLAPNHAGDIIQESSLFNYHDVPGTSSGVPGNLLEETSGSGSSFGGWGSSCKRKTLEGTSGHSCPGESSSTGNDGLQMGSVPHNSSSSFSFPTPLQNSPGSPDVDLLRNFGRRVHPSQHESTALNLSTGVGRSSGPWVPRRHLPSSDSLDLRSAAATTTSGSNTNVSQSQPRLIHSSISSRNTNRLPWSRTSDARAGSSSGSFIPFERGVTSQVEGDLRSIQRNSADHSLYVPLPEMRNTTQEPTGWNLGTGNASSTDATSMRMLPGSSVHAIPSSSWLPQRQQTSVNQQRFSEFSPWSLFPSPDSDLESGGRHAHFPPLSSRSSSTSREVSISSGSSSHDRNQALLRSAMMDGQNDEVLGLPRSMRALATDYQGRHRLLSEIRQVLTAMRRGENLRIEEYLLFDPFIHHGMGEMHDRHRDMRLDVDNMSYEELLALGEQIGDVNTGLNEETILKVMKRQHYISARTAFSDDQEPCCICQEEYLDADDLGVLNCGHEFHTNCIKQWLTLKNICPICKVTALPT